VTSTKVVDKREGLEAGEDRVTYSSPSRWSRTLDKIPDTLILRTSPPFILGRSLLVWISGALLFTPRGSTRGRTPSKRPTSDPRYISKLLVVLFRRPALPSVAKRCGMRRFACDAQGAPLDASPRSRLLILVV
jgi:hypothetical protein